MIAGLVLIAWATVAVAWRWGSGAVVLAVVGLVTSRWGLGLLLLALPRREPVGADMLWLMGSLMLFWASAVVALLAGALFLASWWRSTTRPIRRRLVVIGLGAVGGLAVVVLTGMVVQWWTVEQTREEAFASPTVRVAVSRNMEVVGQVPGDAWDVFVHGKYAYIAAGDDGLRVVDISDPTAPLEVGSCAREPAFARAVFVSDSYAYVVNSRGLAIVDVSDPTALVQLGFYPGVENYDVVVSDSYAYLAAWRTGLRVLDVSDPTAPVQVGSYAREGESVLGVFVSDSYAYLAAWRSGLRVLDVSDPYSPVEVGSCRARVGGGSSVFVAGSYAYVAGDDGLQVVDVSNPASPYEVGFYAAGGSEDVYVSGSYAYLAGFPGLRVLDVFSPATPAEAGLLDASRRPGSVHVCDPYAYLADGERGLFIVRFIQY